MQKRQRSVADAFRRVQDFLDSHADLLAPVNATGARQRLDEITSRIVALEGEQDPMMIQRSRERLQERELRTRLREFHLRPIAAIARARLGATPEIGMFRLPHANADHATMLLAAREMSKAADLYKEHFVAAGLPADFIDRLRATAATLEEAGIVRSRSKSVRIGATAALPPEIAEGKAVLVILSALVKPLLAGTPKLLAGWEETRRILVRVTSQEQPTPTPATPPATETTPPSQAA